RRRSGGWLGPAVAGFILVLTAGLAVGVYTQVIKPRQEAAGGGTEEESEGDTAPSSAAKPARTKGGDGAFPRRALIVSVHNYLYTNPIVDGPSGSPNLERLINSLNRSLRIPQPQIVHLSDAARKDPR